MPRATDLLAHANSREARNASIQARFPLRGDCPNISESSRTEAYADANRCRISSAGPVQCSNVDSRILPTPDPTHLDQVAELPTNPPQTLLIQALRSGRFDASALIISPTACL